LRSGTYGAGLARYLAGEGIELVEGQSDPIDGLAAARAALSGQACGAPKTRTGPVEAIRGASGGPPGSDQGPYRRAQPTARPDRLRESAARACWWL